MALKDTDTFIVERYGKSYQVRSDAMSEVLDTDLFLVSREGVSYKIPASEMNFGGTDNLNPAIPPFVSESGPETIVTNTDGKVVFSFDQITWESSITLPPETLYYCDWTDDILSAANGSKYETIINVDYPNLNTTQDIELVLKIDKLPDPFTLDVRIDQDVNTVIESNTISPLNSINAPTSIWGSSTAINPEIAIADGDWEALPTTINTRYVQMNERIRVRQTTGGTPLTTYSTTLNIGFGTEIGEFESSTFSTTSSANSINTPSIISPENDDIEISVSPTILGTPFDTEGAINQHDSTSWQLATDESFMNMVQEVTNSTTDLTSFTPNLLAALTTYYVRVKYFGSNDGSTPLESEWSDTVEFKTYEIIPSGNFDHGSKQTGGTEVWTVPQRYTRVKVTVASGAIKSDANVYTYGQIVTGEFDVIPGEQFKLGGFAQSRYIGQNLELSQAMLMVVSGGAGMNGSKRDHNNGLENKAQGGAGGSPSPGEYGAGFRDAGGGGGGSLTEPGVAGSPSVNSQGTNSAYPGDPDGLYGGAPGPTGNRNDWGNVSWGGTGGSGWFGGGGGPAEYTGEGGAGGGGGSSNWNITGRNSSNVAYSTATEGDNSYVKIEW